MRMRIKFAYQLLTILTISYDPRAGVATKRTKLETWPISRLERSNSFAIESFHINKTHPLGHGSYGAIYKAKCDQLPCAAKVLHPTILDPNDPGAGRIMQRFQQECAFLENIRHPDIVQYLGMTRDPESRLPVLLMELLDENLTKMLEHSQ